MKNSRKLAALVLMLAASTLFAQEDKNEPTADSIKKEAKKKLSLGLELQLAAEQANYGTAWNQITSDEI
jgi:uncharacterized membrane protein